MCIAIGSPSSGTLSPALSASVQLPFSMNNNPNNPNNLPTYNNDYLRGYNPSNPNNPNNPKDSSNPNKPNIQLDIPSPSSPSNNLNNLNNPNNHNPNNYFKSAPFAYSSKNQLTSSEPTDIQMSNNNNNNNNNSSNLTHPQQPQNTQQSKKISEISEAVRQLLFTVSSEALGKERDKLGAGYQQDVVMLGHKLSISITREGGGSNPSNSTEDVTNSSGTATVTPVTPNVTNISPIFHVVVTQASIAFTSQIFDQDAYNGTLLACVNVLLRHF